MGRVTYRPDRAGVQQFLISDPGLRKLVDDHGDRLLLRARALAARERDSGDYMDKLYNDPGTARVNSKPRVAARVGSGSEHALYVEAGTKHRHASRILRRAAQEGSL